MSIAKICMGTREYKHHVVVVVVVVLGVGVVREGRPCRAPRAVQFAAATSEAKDIAAARPPRRASWWWW